MSPGGATMSESTRRAVVVLGVLTLLGGIAGIVYSAGQSFTAPGGARVGELMHLNPLGSWVSIGLGGLTIVAGWRRSITLAFVAVAGFAACVVAVTLGANRDVNPLGGTASTVGFHLGPGVGVLALALAERAASRATAADLEPRSSDDPEHQRS